VESWFSPIIIGSLLRRQRPVLRSTFWEPRWSGEFASAKHFADRFLAHAPPVPTTIGRPNVSQFGAKTLPAHRTAGTDNTGIFLGKRKFAADLTSENWYVFGIFSRMGGVWRFAGLAGV
jgi:hypothetical protein